jgi:hypothetical protein
MWRRNIFQLPRQEILHQPQTIRTPVKYLNSQRMLLENVSTLPVFRILFADLLRKWLPNIIIIPVYFLLTSPCNLDRTMWNYKLLLKSKNVSTYMMSRDSLESIRTGYGLDDGGVSFRVPVGSRIFSSPRRPDGFWGPPSLISNG